MKPRFSRFAGMALLPLALASCTYLFPQAHHYHAHNKTTGPETAGYSPDVFVRSLTLARLAAQANTSDNGDLRKLEAYTARIPVAPQPQTVLVLTYKDRQSGAPQTVLAPVIRKTAAADWRAVLQVMQRPELSTYILNDVQLGLITVAPDESLDLLDLQDGALVDALDAQQQQLLDSAQALPPLEDARLELQMIGFFIDHHLRDAAYISVDNLQHLLAAASSARPEAPLAIQDMSQQLETLETRLHKAMPFTWSMHGR